MSWLRRTVARQTTMVKAMTESLRVGADIGGTFTDITLVDEAGVVHRAKTLTTHDNPADGVITGLKQVVKIADKKVEQISSLIHGTTLVINALIERRGAKTALVCTEGFRDLLEIANEDRYDMYDLLLEKPTPLVPRELCFPVRERVYGDGSVGIPLDEESVREVVEQLREQEVESVAVSLLHSYKNSEHEQRIGEILRRELPGVFVTLSSDLVPEIREYPRTSTTVANVYAAPVVERYLNSLQSNLKDIGFAGQFLMMLSSGGTCTIETAIDYPIFIIESGPAAGALAAIHYGKCVGVQSLLAFDMGGTTAKSCLIDDGVPQTTTNYEVDRGAGHAKGSGLPIRAPVIEMLEIGAGGGSIAHIDSLGLLKVGPESAESSPGPVSYGLGGEDPTVTDADLALGYLNPDFFLGGRMTLDRDAALDAIHAKVAEPLGLQAIEAAWGIHDIVNENMATAARVHAIERGMDPRTYTLFASGGAGPVHACHVAQKLGLVEAIVPVGAGVASAFGMLTAPLAFEFVRSYFTTLDAIDWARANEVVESMRSEGAELMEAAGVDAGRVHYAARCEMRYQGQTHEIVVPLPDKTLAESQREEVIGSFKAVYAQIYSDVKMAARPIEILNWRMTVAGPTPEVRIETSSPAVGTETIKGQRHVYFPDGGFRDCPVYDRYSFVEGAAFDGPAIVEEKESTTVIPPGTTVTVDATLNLRVHFDSSQ